MSESTRLTRRHFLRQSGVLTGFASLAGSWPLWAQSGKAGSAPGATTNSYDLDIGEVEVTIDGRTATATGINGTVPGPLLRFREGETAVINVRNSLAESSSIHWHGLILPANMDGVPGISFDGIAPGETFRYQFDLVQNGTYWYHSHSDLQEQTGVYGPMIIEPAGPDSVDFDREFVILLSDWTFEDPQVVFAKLKKMDDYYNYQRRTVQDLFADADNNGWKSTANDRLMWGRMRMSASDIADITGVSYHFLMNGMGPTQNWSGLYTPGERLRLRFINGSAMSFFNVRIPGLEMKVVQADGIDIEAVPTDEFQIGVAETYDVIVEPRDEIAYTIFAESMDRSGFARGTLAPRAGMVAEVPELRERPLLTDADMGGMHHGAGDHGAMHGMSMQPAAHDHRRGPGVANITEYPVSRLNEPGTGLANVGHRVLTYADLRGRNGLTDRRKPARELELHLTGNMERYMWSFDGLKYSEVSGPIEMTYGERLRMVLVNDTMMSHPIHLHGMFFELVNGNDAFNPRKHTLVVKPGERLLADLTADAEGGWAFHCHMLYHMKGGMMQEVRVRRREA